MARFQLTTRDWAIHPLDRAFACLNESLNNFHARNMALKLEERKNTTVSEGIHFFFFFTNLEIWRLIMLTLLKNISMEIFYQNNQHDRSKCKPKTADILRLLLLAPAGTRKHADPL